jgi:hypothetical protein
MANTFNNFCNLLINMHSLWFMFLFEHPVVRKVTFAKPDFNSI